MQMYIVIVFLTDGTTQEFTYEANAILDALRQYEVDSTAIYARQNSVRIECKLIS